MGVHGRLRYLYLLAITARAVRRLCLVVISNVFQNGCDIMQ